MGAFIGYGDVGVWASNWERDTFLDWFAAHRCTEGDPRWAYCQSAAHRWSGCGVELEDLIPKGEVLAITDDEFRRASKEHWPDFARLLGIIESITRGQWRLRVNMKAANEWRRDHRDRIAEGET